ncbi:MAG: hypothetical protein M0T83_06440 [Nitrospiraceae bacterium]|nr:hypothetical protein [Nitrospiraceae bacterium]
MAEMGPGPLPHRWILLVDRAGSSVDQMARDREIWPLVRPGLRGILRVYRISGGATVGRTWSGAIPPDWGLSPQSVAIRLTGGGAVLHGQDLCFSLFLSRAIFPPGTRNWPLLYERLHAAFGEFLLWCGHPTVTHSQCSRLTAPGGESKRVNSSFCFSEPVRGDLMVGGSKVLGGALAIGRGGILYQGSLQIQERKPDVLSCLFEEWYRSMGRERIDRSLLMEVDPHGNVGPICQDRAER